MTKKDILLVTVKTSKQLSYIHRKEIFRFDSRLTDNQ